MSAENGTPLEALETGEVANAADASRMANILRDMNASGADVISTNAPREHINMPMQPMPPMQMAHNPMSNPLPPMMTHQPLYIPVEEEQESYAPVRKNIWSRILETILDPLFVGILVLVLSLPVLHTVLGKYASWAYVLGGQLSWAGLLVKSLIAAVLFGLYRALSDFLKA
jgi:hypothetical protein